MAKGIIIIIILIMPIIIIIIIILIMPIISISIIITIADQMVICVICYVLPTLGTSGLSEALITSYWIMSFNGATIALR